MVYNCAKKNIGIYFEGCLDIFWGGNKTKILITKKKNNHNSAHMP